MNDRKAIKNVVIYILKYVEMFARIAGVNKNIYAPRCRSTRAFHSSNGPKIMQRVQQSQMCTESESYLINVRPSVLFISHLMDCQEPTKTAFNGLPGTN